MSKLIQLGLIGFLCLFFACGEDKETVLFYESLMMTHKTATGTLDDAAQCSKHLLMERLQDESKGKYWPTLFAIDTIQGMIEQLELQSKTLRTVIKEEDVDREELKEGLDDLKKSLFQLDEDLIQYYSAFIYAHSKSFQLLAEQIEDKVQSVQQKLSLVDSLWSLDRISLSTEQVLLLISKTEVDLARAKLMLIENLASWSNGRALCGWALFYPTVLAVKESTQVGETFQALIFGFETLAPNSVSLISVTVNDVSLPIIDEKYAYYKSDTLNHKKTTVYINVSARNNLTGYEFDFVEDFPYEIIAN